MSVLDAQRFAVTKGSFGLYHHIFSDVSGSFSKHTVERGLLLVGGKTFTSLLAAVRLAGSRVLNKRD